MPEDVRLTPAQAQLLRESHEIGFVSSMSRQTAQPATAQALIDKGLAEYAMGRDHPGGEYRPTSVWGGPLTPFGKELALRLLAGEQKLTPERPRCTCGALVFSGCFCDINLSDFLATGRGRRA